MSVTAPTSDQRPATSDQQPATRPPISDWQRFRRFLSYVQPHWRWIALGFAAVPFGVAATLFLPWMIIRIIDDSVVPGDFSKLYAQSVLLGGAVVLGYVADAIYTFAFQRSGQKAIAAMREDLFAHVLKMPRSFFDRRPLGVILTRLTSDMEALNESLAAGALSLFTDLLKTLALLVLLISLSWKLTLVVLLILPPIYLISNFLRARLRHYYDLTREALADATGYLQECLSGVKTVQLYAAEWKTQRRFEAKTRHFFKAQSRSNFYDASLFSVIEGITSIALAFMIWYGSGQILEGVVSIGTLVGFINTLNRIFIPIREFTQQIAVFQRALSSLENIDKLFRELPEAHDTPDERPEEAERLARFESLEFRDVWFRYTEDGPWVLRGVSFTVQQGDRLAIVGSTGSGKSTIVRLLTRTYGNYHGSIQINGVELSRIARKHLNRLVAMMQQDTWLFEETIAFNIALNRPDVTPEQVRESAKYVYANNFIERLPGQYDYGLLENGRNLSAGEGRLVVFARAIAGKSEMIVLDEATSSVDSVTEALIQKAIERIFRDKTVIAIAHRLSTIRNSDQILVMRQGEIVERGTHESLLAQDGDYAALLHNLAEAA